MNLRRLKHVTAIALSFWLGFLACALGCVQPVSESAPSTWARISGLEGAVNEEGHHRMADGEPCCHPNDKTSEKNRHSATNSSCCGLEATLIQKQDPVTPLRNYFSDFVLPLLVLHASAPLSANTETSAPTQGHAGREILLQAHILRI